MLKSCQCASQLQPCLGYRTPQGAVEFLSLYKYSHLLRDLIEKKVATCMLRRYMYVTQSGDGLANQRQCRVMRSHR